jgi:hypothetical protein
LVCGKEPCNAAGIVVGSWLVSAHFLMSTNNNPFPFLRTKRADHIIIFLSFTGASPAFRATSGFFKFLKDVLPAFVERRDIMSISIRLDVGEELHVNIHAVLAHRSIHRFNGTVCVKITVAENNYYGKNDLANMPAADSTISFHGHHPYMYC